jgi:hypothetical protein
MQSTLASDRRATLDEVTAHRDELRRAVARHGLDAPRLRDDGTVIVHAPGPGYGAIARFASEAARLVGAYVHVVADDAPAAVGGAPDL